MIPREAFEREHVGRAEDGERREPDGEQQPQKKEDDAQRGGLFAFYFVGDGGEGAQHEPRKQRHDGKGEQIQKEAHAEEARRKPHDAAEGDGQKKARALLEAAEDAAEGIEEFFIEAEDDGDRRAAHPGHDDGEPDECPEDAALCYFLPVLIAQVHCRALLLFVLLLFAHAAPYFVPRILGHYTISAGSKSTV